MKKYLILFAVILGLGGFVAYRAVLIAQNSNSHPEAAVSGEKDARNLRRASLSIEGMWCSSCAVGAEYALKEKKGVIDARVEFTEGLQGRGEVIYNPKEISSEAIIQAVYPYKAKVINDRETKTAKLKSLSE